MPGINDDLIKDLERRANEQKGDIKDEDYEVEDIEAFLKEQEGDDYQPPEPEPSTDTPDAADPAVATTVKQAVVEEKVTSKSNVVDAKIVKEPKNLDKPKAEVVETAPDPRAKKKQASAAAKPVERGRSPGLTAIILFIKFVVFIVPILIAAWIVGVWIGSWISTGWMLAVISLLSVLLPGFIIFIIVRKGRILWWMTGLAVFLGAVLIFAFPTISAESIIRHGHWPVTAITQPLGASPDNFATRGMVSLDHSLAHSLDANIDNSGIVPLELGSAEPLFPTPDATPDPKTQSPN